MWTDDNSQGSPLFNIQVFLDLDGVMFDFDKRKREILGRETKEGDNQIWDELSKHPHLFKELELMPDARVLFDYLMSHFSQTIAILTAIPRAKSFPFAAEDKKASVAQHLSTTLHVETCYAVEKQNYAKTKIKPLLIDDNVKNIAQWSNQGGIGVYHVSAEETIACLEWFRKTNPTLWALWSGK